MRELTLRESWGLVLVLTLAMYAGIFAKCVL